jgi:small-conductance mechanosensitive channel
MSFLPPSLQELPYSQWFESIATAIVLFFLLIWARRLVIRKLEKMAPKSKLLVDDLFLDLANQTKRYFLFALAVYIGSVSFGAPDHWAPNIARVTTFVGLLQCGMWANACSTFWITRHLEAKAASDAATATTIGLISFLSKMVIFVLVVLLTLNNFGVNITALIAGLGVGGVAVALALQNILGDLFASLTIVLDKPFFVGDFIIVGEFMGSVEHIGLKTTRIRSLSGEQIIFPNGSLLQSRIRNYKRMRERRVVFSLTVTYDTKAENMRGIPAIVKEIVEKTPRTRFDRCHFLKFGDSALEFEVVYWVLDPDFNLYADIAQSINLGILERFRHDEIEFAFPTRTLYLENSDRTAPPSL